jgi:hypothetical protein
MWLKTQADGNLAKVRSGWFADLREIPRRTTRSRRFQTVQPSSRKQREGFFAKLTRRRLKRGVFTGKRFQLLASMQQMPILVQPARWFRSAKLVACGPRCLVQM